MSVLLALALLMNLQQNAPAAVPPPPDRTSADCASPVYVVDSLICSDATLLRTESDLARLHAAGVVAPGPWIEDQRAWLSRRARCAFREDQRGCVIKANAERLLVLAPAPGGMTSRTVQCPAADGANRLSLDVGRDGVIVHDADGRRIFAAAAAASDWTPFVQIVSSRRLEFRRQDGAVLRCQPV